MDPHVIFDRTSPPPFGLGPVPALRMDLRFVRDKDSGRFRLCDPESGKFIELFELECLIAQAIDGERSFRELGEIARVYNESITDEQVESLVSQLSSLGLLDHPLGTNGSHPRATTDEFAAFRNEIVLDLERADALRWADGAASRTPLFEAKRIAVRGSNHDLDDDDFDGLSGNTNLAPGSSPFGALEEQAEQHSGPARTGVPRSSGVYTSAEHPSAPAAAAPAAEAEKEEPGSTRTDPETSRSEQEELLQKSQIRRRFYQRGWFRLLVVATALIGASTIIQYPLHVTSECAIVPSVRSYVRSPISGVIAEIYVDEGSRVKKGDLIARLDDRDLTADQRKQVAEIERIEADLARVRKGPRAQEIAQQRAVVRARRAAVSFAEKEAKRRSNMASEGVGSKQAAVEATYDLQLKRNALGEATAALKLLEAGSRPEEIAGLEAQLKRAQAELDFIEQKLNEMIVIRSPIDGTILTPRFRERLHERIEAGGLVAEVSNTATVLAEVFVLEREADSVAIGMPVTVKVESYPLHAFHGTVDFIAPAVESRNSTNVVRVVAKLDNSSGLLRQDMTGYGELDGGKRSLANLATRRFLRWIRVRFLL